MVSMMKVSYSWAQMKMMICFVYELFWFSTQAPEGIHCVSKRFPSLKIVTSEIDVALNEEFRVIPGMGAFGDRYFGTDD